MTHQNLTPDEKTIELKHQFKSNAEAHRDRIYWILITLQVAYIYLFAHQTVLEFFDQYLGGRDILINYDLVKWIFLFVVVIASHYLALLATKLVFWGIEKSMD